MLNDKVWGQQDRDRTNTDLRDLYERHARESVTPEADLEEAFEAVDDLLMMAGYDHGDSDDLGDQYSGPVRSLLLITMLRSAQLRRRILGRDEACRITTEYTF